MKPVMVAKLAIQCSYLYADAVKLLQLETIKSLWPKVNEIVFFICQYNTCVKILAMVLLVKLRTK